MTVTDMTSPKIEPAEDDTAPPEGALGAGTRVEVRTRLDSHRWAKGFEVIEPTPKGYRLRRMTDGEEMPVLFAFDDVRAEKRRDNWWY